MRAWIFVCTVTLLSLPAVALAGGCPTCETTADCEALYPGEVTFCVQWDGPVGCGDLTRLCCPGQGCAIEGGRPSCEGDRCTVVEDLPMDAGPGDVDAGTPGDDGGASGTDSGTPRTDSGTPSGDAGGTSRDAGTSGPDAGGGASTDGGCGCRAAGSPSRGSSVALVLALGLGLVWRRGSRP